MAKKAKRKRYRRKKTGLPKKSVKQSPKEEEGLPLPPVVRPVRRAMVHNATSGSLELLDNRGRQIAILPPGEPKRISKVLAKAISESKHCANLITKGLLRQWEENLTG